MSSVGSQRAFRRSVDRIFRASSRSFLMHERREDRKRVRISVAPRPKKTGEIGLFRHVRWILPPGRAEGCGCIGSEDQVSIRDDARIGLVVAQVSEARIHQLNALRSGRESR